MNIDSSPGFDMKPLGGVEQPLYPYGKYENQIPSKPFDFLSRADLNKATETAPQLIEYYGQNGNIEILSPYSHVFLQTFREIRKMYGFRVAVGDADTNINITGTGPLSPREKEVAIKVLGVLGQRETLENKGQYPTSMIDLFPKEDRSIALFAEDIANHMWQIQGVGTEKLGQYDEFVKNLISYRHNRLGHLIRAYSSAASMIPAHFPTNRSFAETDSAVIPNPLGISASQTDAEQMLTVESQLTADITSYNTTNTAQTPFEVARTGQQNEFVGQNIFGRLSPSELKNPNELPTIVILRGVGQDKALWKERIDYYKSKGINVEFIEYSPFNKEATFEKQAEEIYQQLNKNRLYAIEAHSWGGLIAPYLMKNHPEIISHAIITGAPTRSNMDKYPAPLVAGLKWALKHEDLAWNIIQKTPGMNFFKKLGRAGFPEAFRVYLSHIGEKDRSQWNGLIKSTSWTIPKFVMYGDLDNIVVKTAGMGAAYEYKGAVLVRNPNGGHHVIGNHEDALEIHLRLATESIKRRAAVISQPINEMAAAI